MNDSKKLQNLIEPIYSVTQEHNRQPISIAESGERYLSPVTQLAALKPQIVDINQIWPKIVRNQRINSICLAYSDKGSSLIDKSTSATRS